MDTAPPVLSAAMEPSPTCCTSMYNVKARRQAQAGHADLKLQRVFIKGCVLRARPTHPASRPSAKKATSNFSTKTPGVYRNQSPCGSTCGLIRSPISRGCGWAGCCVCCCNRCGSSAIRPTVRSSSWKLSRLVATPACNANLHTKQSKARPGLEERG